MFIHKLAIAIHGRPFNHADILRFLSPNSEVSSQMSIASYFFIGDAED